MTVQPTAIREKNLRPFVKGKSGNPSGRPKGAVGFRDRCKEFMDAEGWTHLLAMATSPNRDQLPALTLIASYAYGKPTQPLSDPDGQALNQTFTFTIQTPNRDASSA